MTDNVHYLHPRPREIAQVLRVGFLEHRLCEHLLSSGKLAARRFVIEAANFKRQSSLVRSLHDEGAEIVLDTNVAELSVPGKFNGSAKAAPWAVEGRPLEPDDFVAGTNRSVIEPIARQVVKKGVNTVLAPAHFLGDNQSEWFQTDVRSCEALRVALDRVGGSDVAIDYPLILSYGQLRDPNFRSRIIDGLRDLPFDYLWLRVSGFGADATGAGAERFIRGVFAFHELGQPIIADQLGGLTALAVAAVGASSGFTHGVESKERVTAAGWVKPTNRKGGGGGEKSIYIPGLDRRLKISEARALFDNARTSREIFGCPDRTCCGDIETMLNNPGAHCLVQRSRQVKDLSGTPESLRADRFLTEHLEDARDRAKRALRLKKGDEDIKKKIRKASTRLDRIYGALSNLHEQLGPVDFAKEATLRCGRGAGPGAEGRRP